MVREQRRPGTRSAAPSAQRRQVEVVSDGHNRHGWVSLALAKKEVQAEEEQFRREDRDDDHFEDVPVVPALVVRDTVVGRFQ